MVRTVESGSHARAPHGHGIREQNPAAGETTLSATCLSESSMPRAALARRGMLAMQGQPHMLLGRRDRSMRDAWAPGWPWLSRPGTKLVSCHPRFVVLSPLEIQGSLCHFAGEFCVTQAGRSLTTSRPMISTLWRERGPPRRCALRHAWTARYVWRRWGASAPRSRSAARQAGLNRPTARHTRGGHGRPSRASAACRATARATADRRLASPSASPL